MRNEFVVVSILLIVGLVLAAWFWSPLIWWLFVVVGPLLFIGYYDFFQAKHAIMRNYPVLGRTRYLFEELRPKIYQYFVESDTNGRPFSRIMRSIVYQRAKQEMDTTPFGTQLNVYEEGYEWMNHSIAALDAHTLNHHPKVKIGGTNCKQPYEASVLNVSAMSYGSLSSAAVLALNGGAKLGGFAHNTGEGGISSYHLESGGDLIYQIGTGYFGSRAADGSFSADQFKKRAAEPSVKMIEVKLSQGAKPGHGGILPAKKNTVEISKIRNVKPFTDVHSPPFHKEFSTPKGLLKFINILRELSGGKPIGFKLCIGSKSEFFAICKAMVETGIRPDFIAVDGGEGGTGAAPLEFSNSVGTPFKEGVAFVHDALIGFGLREDVKIIASGKVVTGFHILRALALGADACYSARAMMMAVGCIQALLCNKNTCPTGVATQDQELIKGLVVSDKKVRVAKYHEETVEGFVELMAAAGIDDLSKLRRGLIYRRINPFEVRRYDEIFPYLERGALLNEATCPNHYKVYLKEASADKF